jgi:hypothetical protein
MTTTLARTLPISAPQQCSCAVSSVWAFLTKKNKIPAVPQQPYSPAVSPAEFLVFLKLEVSLNDVGLCQ